MRLLHPTRPRTMDELEAHLLARRHRGVGLLVAAAGTSIVALLKLARGGTWESNETLFVLAWALFIIGLSMATQWGTKLARRILERRMTP